MDQLIPRSVLLFPVDKRRAKPLRLRNPRGALPLRLRRVPVCWYRASTMRSNKYPGHGSLHLSVRWGLGQAVPRRAEQGQPRPERASSQPRQRSDVFRNHAESYRSRPLVGSGPRRRLRHDSVQTIAYPELPSSDKNRRFISYRLQKQSAPMSTSPGCTRCSFLETRHQGPQGRFGISTPSGEGWRQVSARHLRRLNRVFPLHSDPRVPGRG